VEGVRCGGEAPIYLFNPGHRRLQRSPRSPPERRSPTSACEIGLSVETTVLPTLTVEGRERSVSASRYGVSRLVVPCPDRCASVPAF
jgi:hypothetical protein